MRSILKKFPLRNAQTILFYLALYGLLYVFHTGLVGFNLFGWMFPKTRRWNLLTLGLTTFSWFVMGIWYGWGYCICTDWQWRLRQRLGYQSQDHTFIQLLLHDVTGRHVSTAKIETITLAGYLISLTGCLLLNFRDWSLKRRLESRRT